MAKELTGTLSRKSPRLSGDIDSKTAQFEAELPGSLKVVSGVPGPPGKTPVKGIDYFTEEDISYVVEEVKKSYSGEIEIKTDETLSTENGTLSVNTIDQVIEDDKRPVTSGAVYQEFSKAVALLKTI